MNKLFFWNAWKKPYKFLYLFLLSIFFISIVCFLVGYFTGIDSLIQWDSISQFDTVNIPIDQFSQNLFNYSIDIDNYITRERYIASEVRIFPWFSIILCLFLSISIAVTMTILTRLELTWFGIGMGIFIVLLVSMGTEVLQIFGGSKKFLLLVILLYAGTGFYFQAYDKKLSFMQRLLVFCLITILLGILIATLSGVKKPFYYLANFGIILPIIITIIFIISISFEIITSFLFITSGKLSNKNSIFHFTFISLLYLVNLILIFLRKKGILQTEFISINVFVIYLASAILGIWGLKKRSTLFSGIITLSYAAFLYISIAIISTITIAYSFATGNDPLTGAFEYAILYSHLGMGIVFFLYILYNFWELFERNLSAYDLVYEPKRMPFFMVRPIGLVIMLSLFAQSGMYAYKMFKSGYHNLCGDVYYSEKKFTEAKQEYYQGSIYANGNLKSNLALSKIQSSLNEKKEAKQTLISIIERNSSEYAYTNLSNYYIEEENFFYALFTLREGIKKFPKSSALYNNLGMLYSTKNITDSTLLYLTAASKYGNEHMPKTNFAWFLINHNMYKEADSIMSINKFPNEISYQINKITTSTANSIKYDLAKEQFLKDSILDLREYALYFNLVINQAHNADTSLLKNLNEYVKYTSNDQYYHELQFLKSVKLYYSGYKKKAIENLLYLIPTVSSSSAPYYLKVLGLWSIQQESYENAAMFFDQSSSFNLLDAEAQLYKSIALLEGGYTSDGLTILKQLVNTPDKDIKILCQKLLEVFSVSDLNTVLSSDEVMKFRVLHFRKDLGEENILKILHSFKSKEYQLLAASDLITYYISSNNLGKAEEIHNEFKNKTTKLDKKHFVIGNLNYRYLQLLEAKGDWKNLLDNSKNIFLQSDKEYIRPYFIAIAQNGIGNSSEAQKLFGEAIEKGPLNENVFIAAANFYNKKDSTTRAYEILLEGIKVNPSSAKVLKAYALQALKLNLTTYGDDVLETLKEIMNPEQFKLFKQQYEKEKAASEAQFLQY